MCSSLPTQSKLHAEVYAAAKAISTRLLPSTTAYHEVNSPIEVTDPVRFGCVTVMVRIRKLQEMLCKTLNLFMGLHIFLESEKLLTPF